MAETLTIEQMPDLEKLLISGEMEKKVQKIITSVLAKARGKLSSDISSSLPNDPRDAYKAVKRSVYKQILGGNMSILNKRIRSGKSYPLAPVKHRLEKETNSKGNHRGGNRMPRTKRTEDLLTYYGSDRGFILRFLNSGTPKRDTNGIRRVGNIGARNFFAQSGQKEMEWAAGEISQLIAEEIANTQF